MNGALKTVLWILVAIVVIGGAYYWYQSRPAALPAEQQQANAGSQAAPTGPSLASGTDTSDAALQQDVVGMDAQMSTMSADTAAIDAGLNDTQIPQQ